MSELTLNSVLLEKDNKAMALSFTGYLFGLVLMLAGNAENIRDEDISSTSGLETIGVVALFSVLGAGMVLLSGIANDRVLLHAGNNLRALHAGNVSVGIFEACGYISTGFMVGGSLAGSVYSKDTLGEDILGVLLFFLLGQIAILAHGKLVEAITPYDEQQQIIVEANPAAGLFGGLNIVALSILASGAVVQAFTLPVYLVWVAAGSLILIGMHWTMDKLVLPSAALYDEIAKDRNWGAAAITGGISIALAVALNTFLRDCIIG